VIPDLAEIVRAIKGTLRLARFDATALADFDRSYDGFWRSFFAAALAAPAYFALVALRLPHDQEMTLDRFLVELGGYVVSWLAYPYAVIFLVRLVDRTEHYFDYMVPYNWAVVLQVFLLLFLAVLTHAGIVPPRPAVLLETIAVIAIMIFQGFIARTGLLISVPHAVAFVAIDLLLNLIIARLVQALA